MKYFLCKQNYYLLQSIKKRLKAFTVNTFFVVVLKFKIKLLQPTTSYYKTSLLQE
ncbi:hypothetical protein SAMN05444362_101640 [Dysgonomonas macrotermitis]|uniref:Uncharacterized protein n=1 Tax=Dysgonomonas macrotermitis TaxID=1346286 RepID=A0A1M4ULK0_9BACT|nr:hypothetical protein SAMN05444362_101640 [Dysgonomonas macrotermitis]